jgi:hypothetical protein
VTARTYGTLEWLDDRQSWSLTVQPDVAMMVKRVLPRVQQTRLGAIVVGHTDEVARTIEWLMDRWPLEASDEAMARLVGSATQHRERGETITDILAGRRAHVALPLEPSEAMTPRPYQRQGYDLARATGSLLLADELGLGKTLTSLLALSDPDLRPALVVTLTGLPRQWSRELRKTFPDLRCHEVTKATPYDLTDADGRTPDLIAMNYAKLAGWAGHLAGQVRTVIFDEVQELRRDGTQKHQAAAQVTAGASLAMGLSATPVYNYGGEMYSILSVLRPELLGDRSEFAREWCKSTYGLDAKTRIAEPEAFRTWLLDQGAMLRRTRADVGIELPPVNLIEQFVDVDEKVWNHEAGNALEVARLILNEDVSHRERWTAMGDLDWKLRQATGIAKAPFVADFTRLILESEEKVILTGWHRACWDIWRERLAEFNPVLYTGSESANQKAQAFDAFMEGRSRVLMLSLRSGAGLDGLQDSANAIVFGELDWSPGVHKQVVGRLHRPGQQHPVAAYFCVTDFGADPAMLDVLNIKGMEADLIMNPDAARAEAMATPDTSEHLRQVARDLLAKHGIHGK